MAKRDEERGAVVIDGERPREESLAPAPFAPTPDSATSLSSDPNGPNEDQTLVPGSGEVSLSKPIDRVIFAPEPKVEEEDDSDPYEDLNNPEVQKIMAVTGRSFDMLGLRHGGDEILGHMILVEVNSKEQIRVFPNGIVPDGTWIPVNHLPTTYRDRIK